MAKDQIADIYRETVASFGREGVDRSVAIEAATEKVLSLIEAGSYQIDPAAAIRASLVKVDEHDGRTADQIIRRAAGTDGAVLEEADLATIVTLGRGRRKPWGEVTVADLASMNEIRFANYRSAEKAYSEFNDAYVVIREAVFMHGTIGAAFAHSGLPTRVLAKAG